MHGAWFEGLPLVAAKARRAICVQEEGFDGKMRRKEAEEQWVAVVAGRRDK